MKSPTSPTASQSIAAAQKKLAAAQEAVRKKHQEQRKEAIQKKITIQKQKQELLGKLIAQQKVGDFVGEERQKFSGNWEFKYSISRKPHILIWSSKINSF